MKNQETQKQENTNKEPVKQERNRQDFQRRNPNFGNGNSQRNPREANRDREAQPQNRENTQNRENNQNRDNNQNRNFQRDNQPRQNYSYQSSQRGISSRVKAVETVEDIKADILRIEKEIDLEIKEIKTMRLGL